MKLECSYVQLPKIYSYLTGNEFKVFTVIYDEWTMMKNENGWFYRSQKLLSEDSGLPLRTLQRTLKKLIEKGVILTTFYNDGVKMATYNKANEYKINLEVIYKLCKKDVKMTTEGCQNGVPSKDIKTNEIRNNKNKNTCIHEHEDLETKVTEDKKENIIKEKVNEMRNAVLNEMEREDKVTITHDHPSSLIEDKMPCVSDCNVYIPKNTDNSPTSHSEDDMDFDTYTSMDLKNRGIKELQRTTSIMSVNKGAGDVENTPMDNLSTSTEKTQQDAKEVAKTQCDERIASIKSDINLDKDGMLKAKTQIQFDACFDDFKAKLNQLKTLLPIDEFKVYRAIQGKWWNATVQYLKFYKDPKQPKQPQQPTTVEMEYYRYHIESMFIAKSVEQMEKAINQISNWFDKMERSYSSSVMKKYEERFENDCVRVAHTNPIFKEWQNKATGEAQAA